MSATITSSLRRAAGVVLLTVPALAGDYYVDSTGGSNANDGLTPGTAWATITFALDSVPFTAAQGFHTIHVAPGDYSAASGEAFPLEAEVTTASGAVPVELVSAGGSGATTITGGSPGILILSRRDFSTQVFFRSRIRRVEGFTIRPVTHGVVVSAGGGSLSPVLRDLVIEGGSGGGLLLSSLGDSFGGTSGDVDDAVIEDCEISGFGGSGVSMSAFADFLISSSCTATITRTSVHGNLGSALAIDAFDATVQATVSECRFEDNGGWGFQVVQDGQNGLALALVDATATVLAGNGNGGVVFDNSDSFATFSPNATFERCTIVNNSGPGITSLTGTTTLDVDTSILVGNAFDVSGTYNDLTVEFSDVGTGNTGGSTTTISANPLFVDASAGDYRLQDGSPCIDSGNPALAPDPDGTVADMGAFPFDQAAVAAYCTGKTNSLGCVPFVSWSGFPSVSAAQPFALRANDVVPGEAGLVVYSLQPANLNFHGGKLCVKAPLQRVLPPKLANATGTPPCTGVVVRNFNARIQSGFDPLLTAGQTAYAQWILRDVADPAGFGDSLTDAARFAIAP